MKNWLFISFSLVLLACNGSDQKSQENVNSQLLDWNSEFIMDDGPHADGYHMDYNNFIKPYYSEVYKTDTLIVSTIIEVNTCWDLQPDLEFNGIDLLLTVRNKGEDECTSTMFHKFTYVIHNPKNEHYNIACKH